jgi:hypothetical protein
MPINRKNTNKRNIAMPTHRKNNNKGNIAQHTPKIFNRFKCESKVNTMGK